jgi:hypothetical protein
LLEKEVAIFLQLVMREFESLERMAVWDEQLYVGKIDEFGV